MKKIVIPFLILAWCPLILPKPITLDSFKKPIPEAISQPSPASNQPTPHTVDIFDGFYKELLDDTQVTNLKKEANKISDSYKIHPEAAVYYNNLIIEAYNRGHQQSLISTGRYFQHGLNTMAKALQPAQPQQEKR